jgi:hypothetical protein
MKPLILALGALVTALSGFAQKEKIVKKIPAVRTTQKIQIDGDINDEAWKTAPVATDFVEWRPTFGRKEDEKNRTEVQLLYDNDAIYIGGFCHETSNDSLSTELVGRDVIRSNDFIGVLFDTYNDKINGFGYFVTPLGEQFDAKYSSTGEDPSWNSVYQSEAKIVPGGWTFEMRIPYSAIRFSNKPVQDWGLNITRRRSKSGIQLMWNPTDPTFGGYFLALFGMWTGIENIKPPVRLSFSPYLSTYATHYPYNDPTKKNTSTSVNGGMDLKYGINQAFTLDMTLIPDFGQVQSDNKILNLTPFEVKYNENRTFFTEGTELFSKGNLFYSRRIGGEPLHYNDVYNQLQPGETITRNPKETRLINATKISGRTSSGLGIGFFNAITKPQYATVEYNGKEVRKIETEPLTNYNILVLDQSLKNNSSVSLINTNVTRAGKDYDANVTAGLWDIYDKKNVWNTSGKVAVSNLIGYLPEGKTQTGYNHNFNFGKTGGRFNFMFTQELSNNKYSHNDMGYFTNNNFLNNFLWVGYKWLTPKAWYNRINLNFNFGQSMRYKPWDFQNRFYNISANTQLKSLWWMGTNINMNPEEQDFYEPRIAGKMFKRPASFAYGAWFESNYAKKYATSVELVGRWSNKYNSSGYDISARNQYRFNKKLTITINTNLEFRNNNIGFATTLNDSSIFALRKRYTVENVFNVKYNFTNKTGLSFRARHYWSNVNNQHFFNLKNDGSLDPLASINKDVNNNVNYFNIDMVYTWQFALGSFLNIVWKNSVNTFDTDIRGNYFKNAGSTFEAPQLNSLSLRVIYFLDYLSLKKHKS